ncbi:hypothetical protein E4T56_gene12079 [Termitomyces sp. T112]|nr:hypothetical protein E4T56_gene12079 [Termitomyces sp. T112]KAH0578151.1 hypothetical protein H2248_004115 [Termitomyces sp. 'cryptogamus']KNZ71593.1 hypothetical protein J132_08104 [Termitomyces sp. J132]
MTNKHLVWLITGTSSGLGRELVIAALKRGDKVIATARARSLDRLDVLKVQGADILELDVTDTLENLREVARKAVELYGRVDVLINNAGYLLVGAIEENTPEETFDEFNTNVLGALNVARAFLPYMRERQTGTILFLGSLRGWGAFPNAGIYTATKFALRGLSTTLHAEISPLGLRSICAEFGYFRTPILATAHRVPQGVRIPDYGPVTDADNAFMKRYDGSQLGDPVKGVELIVDVVRGEGLAHGKPFPTVLAVGSDCYNIAKTESEKTLIRLEDWKDVSCSTDYF